jgi:chromosome segregation ATPase
MGCQITKLPPDIETTLEKQQQTLNDIYTSFQPMEDEIHSAIQKKKETFNKIQEIVQWKNESEKKIRKLEKLFKKFHSEMENGSKDLSDMNSLEILIEDQHDEILRIISELKSLS